MVAEFLDLEQHLKRRFREDSITDILIASLLSLPGNNIVVLTPPEVKTGGDFDLIVIEPGSGDAVQFRIQAKRLTPHQDNWTTSSYAELAHPKNSGAQSRTLISGLGREAIPTIPLYAFYNPAHVCAASGGVLSGVELASGWEVRERVKAIVKAKPKRLPFKRIGSLQPLFFPLTTILCPPIQKPDGSMIPLPSEARKAVEQAMTERSGFDVYGQMQGIISEARLRVLAAPTSFSDRTRDQRAGGAQSRKRPDAPLPAVVRSALERREERIIAAKVKRPRILLIAEPSHE